ncbi:hypothetical protein CL645_00195 [bacterium]|nr:hypothetical protein [bacterium]|tara:strand:- start:1441 stop:1728 length:288 start_codon:yes stop_codon:yes gene_type:complete
MFRKIFSGESWQAESDEDFASNIVDNGLGVPSIFLLEVAKPLNVLASSAFTVLSPVGHLFFDREKWDIVPDFFSDRKRIEQMINSIEKELAAHES